MTSSNLTHYLSIFNSFSVNLIFFFFKGKDGAATQLIICLRFFDPLPCLSSEGESRVELF